MDEPLRAPDGRDDALVQNDQLRAEHGKVLAEAGVAKTEAAEKAKENDSLRQQLEAAQRALEEKNEHAIEVTRERDQLRTQVSIDTAKPSNSSVQPFHSSKHSTASQNDTHVRWSLGLA